MNLGATEKPLNSTEVGIVVLNYSVALGSLRSRLTVTLESSWTQSFVEDGGGSDWARLALHRCCWVVIIKPALTA